MKVSRPLVILVAALTACTSGEVLTSTSAIDPAAPTTSFRSDVEHPVDPAFPVEFLSGSPLDRPSGLLIVEGNSVVDIDAGTVERIGGLPDPAAEDRFWSVRAGSNAIIWCYRGCSAPDVFILKKGESTAQSIGTGSPTPGVDGVWLQDFGSCVLTKVDWDGETLRPKTEFDCGAHLIEETPLGLVAWTETNLGLIQGLLIEPDSLTTVVEVGEIHGVIEDEILYSQEEAFILLDTETGSETKIEFPTEIGQADYGQPSPNGRWLAVAFKHPAWPGPRQRLDVWLLDMTTLEWTRLPSMPVAASLKGTDFTWTADGRLVLYGAFDEAGVAIATYSPGDEQLQVSTVDHRPAASIVAWCTSPKCNT